ncbi:hypothetical protein ACQRBV_22290 [Pseudomonas sp. R11F]|uniref:hypothetical protein n=1 Tax=Pseudomonas TaxID=286 RepID=UPI00398F6647
MSVATASTFQVFFRRGFKHLLEHWTPFTVTVIFLGTGFGMLSLYIYTKAIGRADIFMSTLDAKSALLVWVFVVMFMMTLQLAVLMVSAWLYGMSVSLLHSRPEKTRFIALWLLLPLVVGFITFMALAFKWNEDVGAGQALLIVLVATLLALFGLTRIRQVRELIEQSAPEGHGKWVYVPIALMLFFTVVSGAFPTLLILGNYVGQDDAAAVKFVAVFSIFTFVFSLIPALLFFVVKGSLFRRLSTLAVSVLIFFVVFLLSARGAMSSITYIVAGTLEIRQTHAARFILEDQVKLGDLDSLQWHTRLRDDGRVQVQAYQLFAFGDLLLICPVALHAAKLHQLPLYTKLCWFTRASSVHRMPPQMNLHAPPTAESIWTRAAAQRLNWESVRINLTSRISLLRDSSGG